MANLFRCGSNQNSNLGAKLLWTNPSPTSAFAGQKIQIDLSKYDGVIVEFNVAKSVSQLLTRAYIRKDDTSVYTGGGGYYSPSETANAASRARSISVSDDGVTIGKGYTNATDNGSCIPTKIYGINIVLE